MPSSHFATSVKRFSILIGLVALSVLARAALCADWKEDFDLLKPDAPLSGRAGWEAFEGGGGGRS